MSNRRLRPRANLQGDQGCPYGAGPACGHCDGSCWDNEPVRPDPTPEDYCAGTGHAYYADQQIKQITEGLTGRCYCGARTYPPGG